MYATPIKSVFFGSTLVSTKMTILATARLLCNHWTQFKVALTLSFKSIICGYFCFGVFLGGGAELVWMYFCLGKYQLHVNQSPCMLQRCSSGLQGVATLLYAFVRFFRIRNRLDGPFSGDRRLNWGGCREKSEVRECSKNKWGSVGLLTQKM